MQFRHPTLETLEDRRVLSGLSPIADQSVMIGGPLLVPILNADAGPITYTVTPADTTKVTATVMKTSEELQMKVHGVDGSGNQFSGEMDFLLLDSIAPQTIARITALANGTATGKNFYDGLTFHRIIQDFMVQGGDPNGNGTGGSGTTIPDEFQSQVLFTQSGLLAMANSNNASATPPVANTNDSQFFITANDPNNIRSLDTSASASAGTPETTNYTIFGMLISGDNIRQDIASTQVESNGQGENSKPLSAPIIDSIRVVSDTSDGLLQISLPSGVTTATGSTPTQVTVTPSSGAAVSFNVSVNAAPALATVSDIHTTMNTAIPITLSATDAESDPLAYFGGQGSQADSADITANIASDGTGTVTPSSNVVGLQSITFAVTQDGFATASTTQANFADQDVPVFISPLAPTLQFASSGPQSGGETNLNNTAGKTLSFAVTGVLTGQSVTLTVYADATTNSAGTVVATTTLTPTSSTVDLTSNGTATLADGAHNFTVTQTIQYAAATVGSESVPAGSLASVASAALPVTVNTAAPTFTSTPGLAASVSQPYSYQAAIAAAASETITFSLVTKPAGMTVNSGTGLVTWTPQSGQGPQQAVDLRATDQAGNYSDQTFTIQVADSLNQYNRNPVVDLPTTAGGNRVTIRLSGSNVQVLNNVTNTTLLSQPLLVTYSVTIVCADGEADQVTVDLAYGGKLPLTQGLVVQGNTNPGNNALIIQGTAGANTFQVDRATGGNTVTADGLTTTFSAVGRLRLQGGAGSNTYKLDSSTIPVGVIATSGSNTIDLSGDSGGVTLNLGLNRAQPQPIAPWSSTMSIVGNVGTLVGTNFSDVLTAGNAAMTVIHGGGGNDTIRGGAGQCILFGDTGNSTLYGGSGNSLLIAGTGSDSLYAGTGQSILVGGSTTADNNIATLTWLLQHGSRGAMVCSMIYNAMAKTHQPVAGPIVNASLAMVDHGAKDYLFGNKNTWFVPGKAAVVVHR